MCPRPTFCACVGPCVVVELVGGGKQEVHPAIVGHDAVHNDALDHAEGELSVMA